METSSHKMFLCSKTTRGLYYLRWQTLGTHVLERGTTTLSGSQFRGLGWRQNGIREDFVYMQRKKWTSTLLGCFVFGFSTGISSWDIHRTLQRSLDKPRL